MFNPALSLNLDIVNKKSTRDGAGFSLLEEGKANPNLFVLSADLRESTRVEEFSKLLPNQYIEIGVAEQNLAGIASGIASCGNTAVINSFAVFSPGRNWDQIRVSICYSNLNVKIIGHHAGLLTAQDGATHQALEDIAITRVLPNMIVVNPCDYEQMVKAISWSVNYEGPVYIRSYREKLPQITTPSTPLEYGMAQKILEGKDLTIISSGPILFEVLEAVTELENKHKISIELLNLPFIKPIDSEALIQSINKTKKAVVIEEHQIHGGVGSAVLEAISETAFYPTKIIGVKDTFGESGTPEELYEKYEISSQHIVKKILQFLERIK
jgi:transketolase